MKRKRFILILLVLMVLYFVGDRVHQKMVYGKYKTHLAVREEGIYYEELDADIVGGTYDPLICYMYSALWYHNQIYTLEREISAEEDKDAFDAMKNQLDKKLEEVYQNGVYWSTEAKRLQKINGVYPLYSVKGYDMGFCVAVLHEDEANGEKEKKSGKIEIFRRLNGIWMKEGYQLYEERLHLSSAHRVCGIRTSDSVYMDKTRRRWIEFTPELTQEFLEEINQAQFVKRKEKVKASQRRGKGHFTVCFQMDNGMEEELSVYDNGYVALENKKFYLQISLEMVEKLSGVIADT